MTKTEAAQQALDALDELREFGHHVSLPKWARISIALKAALKAVLDQPEQKPLTEEEILLAYQKQWHFHPSEEPNLAKGVVQFVRFIEQAHGIGEKP